MTGGKPRLEVLAPAGSMEALTAAVRCGADAVYLGQKNFSARKNSQNFDGEELREAVAYAHRCGVKIHQALNIVVFQQELEALKTCIRTAVEAGVDAMIVQDWGVAALVRRFAPDMPLHASTQMAVHSPAGAKLAEELGFSRVVLARELTREEIEAIVRSTSLETEIFVHGAHCMSVSGQCYLSAALGGKSGNRGQCAQPCRLPFTAGGAGKGDTGENVLSLKDMDIIPRLPEIERMGVTSVKIEGRMKRPEYVAAAVTACRQALAGETPDLGALQAVFSRSGFTSGYFDGKRDKTMFGFRTHEDVTAAAGVLGELKNLYHKERPLVPVSMELTARPGEPVSLFLSDGEHTVSAAGETAEPAGENRPADAAFAYKQLARLGSTPYFLPEENLRAEMGGVSVRPAALNQLRREAVEKLDREREQPRDRFVDSPLPAYPARQPSGTPAFWGKFQSAAQFPQEAEGFFDRIILPAAELLRLSEAGALRLPAEKLLPVLPRFTFDESGCPGLLERLWAAGFRALYCESGAHLALAKGTGHPFICYGGPYLNLANPEALAEAGRLGLAGAVLSPEGKLSQLRAAARVSPIETGLYGYGRMALMALRNCPVKAQIGCKACGRQGYLTDRKGIRFPVRCGLPENGLSPDNRVSILLNSLPLSMSDKQAELSAFSFILLDFTVETPEEAAAVVRRWRTGSPEEQYTRGLYTRGVL